MDDGVTLDSKESRNDANGKLNRTMHGTAPTAQLAFTALGDLHTAHLERGVEFNTLEDRNQNSQMNHTLHHWNSPIADLEFQKDVKGGVALKTIHGIGGTTIKGESQRTLITGSLNHVGPTLPSRLAADDLVGIFNSQGTLDSLTGTGHSLIEETTETGAHQLATGDKLDAHFIDEAHTQSSKAHTSTTPATGLSNLDHATLVGHVVLVQTPPTNTANKSANSTTASNNAPIRATAGHAYYEGAGEWLHLTLSPRVENGGVEMTAERIDVSRASGDAFAHTNVKASWVSEKSPGDKSSSAKSSSDKSATAGLGGQGPTHVVSTEAELKQSTNEAIFTNQARLWQGSNSVAAPIITLNREHQTLFAEGSPTKSKPTAEPPVYAVFLSAAAPKSTDTAPHPNTPQLMRFHGAHLKYSAAERKAWLSSASSSPSNDSTVSAVTADTGSGRVQSDSMELTLLPVGVTNSGPTSEGSTSQVDHLTAHGHVQLNSSGRHGTGEQLIYSGETGEYTLMGTAASPPKLNDPTRGTVTGETLIFQSRDDSVKVVGPGTSTETTTQK
jgi:lipopolysaccharide export system protein LptA